jgi:co-chaperonin GroES (HSP10)
VIRPLRDMLVLKPIGKPPGMVGLIHMPDTDSHRVATGSYAEVVAAGPEARQATQGKTVYVKAYGSHLACDEVIHEGETLFMTRERDIIGVVP